jgi:hypothetical protein
MLKEVAITFDDDETKYSFTEWCECPDILEITLSNWTGDTYEVVETFPVLSKEDWEEFKRAGDMAFTLMRGK